MNRRELLQMVSLTAIASPLIVRQDDSFDPKSLPNYRGFKIRWRGFFFVPNQDVLVGQWIAYNPTGGFNVYSSYPGATGQFWNGQILDMSKRDWQQLPTMNSTETELLRYRTEAFDKLVDYLEAHYKELTR